MKIYKITEERIAELEAQNAELHRDGMEPRAVLRSRIAELEATIAGKDKCLSELEDEIIRLQGMIDAENKRIAFLEAELRSEANSHLITIEHRASGLFRQRSQGRR